MKSEIYLKSSHLIIPAEISNQVLKGCNSVYVAYKEDLNLILVSPKTNTWFPKLHSSLEFILKNKDLHGTKSIAIHEIFIDHDLESSDKTLICSINQEQNFLKIELPNFNSV
jgi:hypothetical protein|tara:strand:+ start:5063 stop:5398 length:336 start_codon:yes stop_codon:yes gene_type:complete